MSFTKIASGWIETEAKPTYHGWPTLCRLKSGRLLAAASGGREMHVCPFGRVHCYASDDGGLTWSKPLILSEGPLDDRDCGLAEAADGSVLLNYVTSIGFAQYREAPPHWRKLLKEITLDTLDREHGFWMRRSTDGGRTWSAKYRVPLFNIHGPTRMDDGSLLWVGNEFGNPLAMSCRKPVIRAYRSTDHGLTWEFLSALPDCPGQSQRDWYEVHTVQNAKGLVITQFRNHADPLGEVTTWQVESADDGRTWGSYHRVARGYPSHLVRLADGRVVMTYGWRHTPCGVRFRVGSEYPENYWGPGRPLIDKLMTGWRELPGDYWSEEEVLCDDGETYDLGYPSTVQLADETLVTLWYQYRKSAGLASLRWLKWKLD